jgi:alanyl-tRNA synthetase
VHLQVDTQKRTATALNHTATHLLQAALRQVLGDHVKQSGSLVTPERFRFDFTHYTALTKDELLTVEKLVNQNIRENYPVETSTIPYQQAIQSGALALFGEKYSDTVRTVKVASVSMELCGGTHTQRTGDIGLLKIIGESSAAAGIRRIEALTGEEAITFIKQEEQTLRALTALLKTTPEEIVSKTSKLLEENKRLQREVETVKQKMVTRGADTILSQVREIRGIKVLATRVEAQNPKTLRDIADRIKDQLHSGIIIVGGEGQEKAFLVVVVTKDLTPSLHAGNIIQEVAQGIGGSGGGRADMAQAGGKEKDKLDETLERAYPIIEGMIP